MCSVPSELNDKRKSLFKWLVYCFWFISDSGRKNHNVFASALEQVIISRHTHHHQRKMKIKNQPGTGWNDKLSRTSTMAVVNWDLMDDHRFLSLPLGGSTEWKTQRGMKADGHFRGQNLRDWPRPRRHLGAFVRLCCRSGVCSGTHEASGRTRVRKQCKTRWN